MSRQEDFIEAGIQYRFKQGKPMAIGGDTFAEMVREANRNRVYEDGCEYGYQYAVENACEWLINNVNDYIINDIYLGGDWYKVKSEMFDDFRKAMEG